MLVLIEMILMIRLQSASLINKMLFITTTVIFIIAGCGCINTKQLSDRSNTRRYQQTTDTSHRSHQQSRRSTSTHSPLNQTLLLSSDIGDIIALTDRSIDFGEAQFTISCPIEDIISPKDEDHIMSEDDPLRKELDKIKDKIGVSWLKDSEPWTTRINGNHITKVDKFSFSLFQVGNTDEGQYTCLLDYGTITRNFTLNFKFSKGATFYLDVIDSLPDLKPTITHPPSNQIVKRGSDVTFTCHRTVTNSHQTTYWLKGCPLKDSGCIERFNSIFDDAIKMGDHKYLLAYSIRNSNVDTFSLQNVTEELTGYYGCVVFNEKGFDARLAKLELFEQWFDEQKMAGTVRQVQTLESNLNDWIWYALALVAMIVLIMASCIAHLLRSSILRDKKPPQQNTTSYIKADENRSPHNSSNLRQHLPNLGCPNIYNISKSADGIITGHLHQTTGHLLAQSICSNILDKKNPSISSSNSQQSDEASSSSWGKSLCSQGDNCRALYLHTSNTTATTVPMYDHPPSNGTLRHCNTMVQNTCINNPTYGFLKPETDNSDWAFPRRNLSRLDKIGEGQFGVVWRYIARHDDGNSEVVAVKQLKHRLGFSDRERLELLAEIEIMKSVNSHPNVIKLLHYCVDEYEPILLIMEYAEHGKLQTYLRSCRASSRHYGFTPSDCYQPSITSKELIKFTYHIAKGMEYVASQGIVHRDLASRNILVSRDKVCKVADFGFARRVNEDCAYERTTTNPVPVKWMAPEALIENKFTSKSDVFSLGILMWEIVTLGATPYEQLSSEGVYKKVTTGGRLERPAHCSDEFYNLMAQCWLHDPALRPTFKEVASELEKLLLSDNDYIKLDQYPEHAYYNIINKEEKEVVKIGT